MKTIAAVLVTMIAATTASAQNRAQELVFLPQQDVVSSFPALDAALPTNGRLVLFGTDVPDGIAFVRILADGGEAPLVHDQIGTGTDATFAVTMDGLVAGELVTVASRCPGCFVGTWTVIDFVDATAPTFDDGPTKVEVTPLHENLSPFATGYAVSVTLPGARDDSGNVLVRIIGDGFSGHAESAAVGLLFAGGEERTVCMEAVAIDAAGNETAFPDELCADLDDGGGCAQVPAPTLAGLAVLLLLRRRSR